MNDKELPTVILPQKRGAIMKFVQRFLATAIALVAMSRGLNAQTYVQGNVSGTWTAAGSPYIAINHLTVPGGQTLTIQPGVVVRLGLGLNLTVGGTLNAIGTAAESIRVTTTQPVPAPGQWGQILVSGSGTLRYCIIEYGASSGFAIQTSGSSVALDISNSMIRNNTIGASLSGLNTSIRNSNVRGNLGTGLSLDQGAVAQECDITNNGNVGIASGTGTTVIKCSLTNNGGGISSSGTGITVIKCSLTNNGGGIYINGTNSLIRGCTVRYSNSYGIVIGGSFTTIDSCIIAQNAAGGIALSFGESCSARHNIIFGNSQAGIIGDGANDTVENNTVVGNGSGITYLSGTAIVRNNVIANNTGNGVHTLASPPPTVKFNNVYGNTTSFSGFSVFFGDTSLGFRNRRNDACDPFSNINLNPMFVNPANGDYHLMAASHMIDAGDTLSQRDPDSTITDIGAFYYTHTVSVHDRSYLAPAQFILSQNYPNPFNPSTKIEFSLPKAGNVTLKVFDVLGREVATLVSENLSAGTYQREWNAGDVASGMYFYRLKAGDFVQTKKLLLVR
jgi:parallel beta-helix repeat protein